MSTSETQPRGRRIPAPPARFQVPWLRTRQARLLMIAIGILLAYALPIVRPPILTTPDSDFGGVLTSMTSYALVAVGLNIVIGYAGLLDLGYVGFYAVGAYTTGVLTAQHWHWPFLLVLPVAIAVTMVTGVILGAPTLRVRGDYLAIVTLGFGEIIRITITNTPWLGGAAGIKDIPAPPSLGPDPVGVDQDGLFQIPHIAWNGLTPLIDNDHKTPFLVFGVLDAVPYYWLLLTVLLIVLVADILIKESRVGRAWEATREDEEAAELMGVRPSATSCWPSPSVPRSVAWPAPCWRPVRAASSVPPASSCSTPCSSWPRSSSVARATGGGRSWVAPWSPTCPSGSAVSATGAC